MLNDTESVCAEPLFVRQKSALKIAVFRVSDWLRSTTAWGLWLGSLGRVLGSVGPPSLISLMVSVDVKHHVYLLTYFGSA